MTNMAMINKCLDHFFTSLCILNHWHPLFKKGRNEFVERFVICKIYTFFSEASAYNSILIVYGFVAEDLNVNSSGLSYIEYVISDDGTIIIPMLPFEFSVNRLEEIDTYIDDFNTAWAGTAGKIINHTDLFPTLRKNLDRIIENRYPVSSSEAFNNIRNTFKKHSN